MKKEDNERTASLEMARKIHSIGRSVRLSKKQKKTMLRSIMQESPSLFTRIRNIFLLPSMALTAVLTIGIIFFSQPGSPLYAFRRSLEDVRSKVQPSYDAELLKRREEEITNVKINGGNENDIEEIEKEKQEIENRILQRHLQNQKKQQDSDGEHENDDKSKTTDEDDAMPENHSDGIESQSASDKEESCKNNLDVRKKNGENIASEAYKACDER